MKRSLSTLNFRLLGRPLLVAASIALASCAEQPPQAQLLSRLPASHPDAAASSIKTLSNAERQSYAEIDKQVLEEQQQAIIEDAAAQAAYHNRLTAPIGYGYYHSSPIWGLGFPLSPIWRW